MFVAITASIALTLAAASVKPANPVPAKTGADEVVCKLDKTVNSRIPKRLCMTRGQWEEMARGVRDTWRSSSNRVEQCTASKPC